MSNLHPRKRRLVIEKEEADVTSSREANVNQGAKKKNKANATALECNTTESPTAGVKMKNNPIPGESVSEKHPVRPSLCIAVGTYEHTLRSWKMIPQCNNSPARNVSFDPTLVPFFTDTKHSGSIQCIASNHKWLITGGRDEVLYIYNLKKCSCVGDLALDGEATQVLLTTNHHLLCSTTSGRVHVWKVSSWDIVAAIELHSRACNGIALHPSQKLGLSVGNDRCVSLVNFVKGIKALEIKHKQPLTGVSMAPTTGESYTLIKHHSVDIVSTALGTTQHTLPIEANVVQYISDDLIITGSQDGNITLWDVTNATIVTQQQLGEVDYFPHKQEHKHTEELETSKSATFTVRCRDLSVIRDTLDNELVYITAITSCGVVSVWSLSTRDFHSGKQTVDGDPVLFRLVAKGSRYSSRFMCVASAWIG